MVIKGGLVASDTETFNWELMNCRGMQYEVIVYCEYFISQLSKLNIFIYVHATMEI